MTNAFGIHGALPGVMTAEQTAARGKIGNLSFAVLTGSPKRRPADSAAKPPRPFNVVETRQNGAIRKARKALERCLGKTTANVRRGLLKGKDGHAGDAQRDFARLDRMAGKAADLGERAQYEGTQHGAIDIHRILQDQLLQRGTGPSQPEPAGPGAKQVDDLVRLKRATGHWMRGTRPGESVEQVKRAFDAIVNDESALLATRDPVEALCRGLADADRSASPDGSLHIGTDIVKGFRHLLNTRRMSRSAAEDVAFHLPAMRMLSQQPNGVDTLSRALCALSAQAGPGWEQAMNRWLDDQPQQLAGDAPRSEVLKQATDDLNTELRAFRTVATRVLEEVAQSKIVQLADSSLRDTAGGLQILYESVASLPGCKGDPQECGKQIRALYEHALHNALLPLEARNLQGVVALSAPLTGALATIMEQVDGELAALRCPASLDSREVNAMRKRLLYGVLDRMGVRQAIDGLSDSMWLATQRAQQGAGTAKRGKARPAWTAPRGKEVKKDRARMAERTRKDMLNRFDALLTSFQQGEDKPAQKAVERKLPGILDGRRALDRFGTPEDAWIKDIDKRLADLGEEAIRRMRNGPLGKHMAGRMDLLAHLPAKERDEARNVLEGLWLRINIAQARMLARDYIATIMTAATPGHDRLSSGQPGPDGMHGTSHQERTQREQERDQKIYKATDQLSLEVYMTFHGAAMGAIGQDAASARMDLNAMGQGLRHCWQALRDDELVALLNVFSRHAETRDSISLRQRQDHIALAPRGENGIAVPPNGRDTMAPRDATLARPGSVHSASSRRLARAALNEAIFQTASQEALARLARAGAEQGPALRAGLQPEAEALWNAVDSRLAVQLNDADAPELVSRLVRHACVPDTTAVPEFVFTGARYEPAENRLSGLRRPFEALDKTLSAACASLGIGLCRDDEGDRIDIARAMTGLRQAVLEQTRLLLDMGDPASHHELPWRTTQKVSRPVSDRGVDDTVPFPLPPPTPQSSVRMRQRPGITLPPPPAERPISPPRLARPDVSRQASDAGSEDGRYERISLDYGRTQARAESSQSLYDVGSGPSLSAPRMRPTRENTIRSNIRSMPNTHHYDTVSDAVSDTVSRRGSDSGIVDMSSEESVDEYGYQIARQPRGAAGTVPEGRTELPAVARDSDHWADDEDDWDREQDQLANLELEAAQRRKREALRTSMA
jgi:hypothetical protein